MAYVLPQFNLLCDIYQYTDSIGGTGPFYADVPCNLAFGRRTEEIIALPHQSTLVLNEHAVRSIAYTPTLLLPSGTDVWDGREYLTSGVPLSGDWIEVPKGTGNFYYVLSVQDMGKGFANEHRAALLYPMTEYFFTLFGNQWNVGAPARPIL